VTESSETKPISPKPLPLEPRIVSVADSEAEASCGLAHKTRISTNLQAPLILLVHGRAGNFDVMWTFRRAFSESWNAIAPQAPVLESPMSASSPGLGAHSWWEVKEASRSEPAAMQSAATLLQSFLTRAITHYKLAPTKIIALGFSQGAAVVSIILQRPKQPFNAVGLLAGFVIKNRTPDLLKVCPVQMCHGERDEVVPLDLARKGYEHLSSLGFTLAMATDPVGHKIGPAGVRALKSFLATYN